MIKNIFIIFFLLVLLVFATPLFFSYNFPLLAQSTDQNRLDELNKQIAEYEAQIARLNSEANTLSNQIANYDAQIKLTSLKIAQTQEKISSLADRISQLDESIDVLSKAFVSRVVETYKIKKLHDPVFMLIASPDLGKAFSNYHYLTKIQQADSDLLLRLGNAQDTYEEEKKSQEKLKKELVVYEEKLNSQKAAKNSLLIQTRNDERRYQALLKEAQEQLLAFKKFVSSQGGASILVGQTRCDEWGCYFNQRDSEWGNMPIGNSNSSMAEYGCLVTSMAMIASHYKKSIKPSDIALTPSVFFGNTAYMTQGTWVVNGVTTTRTRVCYSCGLANTIQKIDSELGAGRPVIVGLYSGPDHFIVLKGKEGSEYIMHDPFLKDGGNRKFSEKYSVSDIKTVDYVSIN
jgi:hypothetical protein